MAPTTMRAITSTGEAKQARLNKERKVPALRPDYVLVKVTHVALNPTDWKHIDYFPTKDAIIGCDYAGIVEEVGSAVKKPFKKGDRIAGFVHGGNRVQPDDGGFAEYIVAKGDVQMKVPDNISDAEAATTGVGVSTCGQGMYQSLQLPWPNQPAKEKIPLLIYGGSTATGLYAVQFAKLSNLQVIATCSPRNFDLVKSFGADHVFDYSDPDACAKSIRDLTNNNLKHAFDCISEGKSPEICANALTSGPGAVYSNLLSAESPRKDVESKSTLGYTIAGEAFEFFRGKIPAKPEDFEFAVKFWEVAEKLIAEKKIKLFPTLKDGGLEGVLNGLDDLRNGRVSGQKLVYKV